VKYLLDTHTWIWWNASSSKLSKKVKGLLENEESFYLSDISVWEFCKLVEMGRYKISTGALTWVNKALESQKISLVRVSPEISFQSTTLPLPFHSDPADRMIVATAMVIGATLLTKDTKILKYSSIKALWK
tara:strand:- start:502 stop:894 length:393 start_codon:yes stop_codon:yes gene_type:complete